MLAQSLGDDILFEGYLATTHLLSHLLEAIVDFVNDRLLLLPRQNLVEDVPPQLGGQNTLITTDKVEALDLLVHDKLAAGSL